MWGFEAKGTALLHDEEEHDQGLVRIDKGMSPVGTGGVMLPKAFKQGKQQGDIVGKGRCDHSGASWKVFAMFSRRNLLLPAMSTDLCTPLNYVSYIRNVDVEVVNQILHEFAEMAGSIGGMVAGGKEYVRKLLLKSLDPAKAEWIINNLSIPTLETGLEALRWLDAKTIARFLQGEHPQTVAVILAHLDAIQAGTVLTSLPSNLWAEVLLRIAKLERIPPGEIQELDKVLRNELRATGALETGQVGGIQSVAEILNNVDQTSEREIMEQIEEPNAGLAEEIRQLMFVFEDLITVDDRGMQQILRSCQRRHDASTQDRLRRTQGENPPEHVETCRWKAKAG
jgi:FliG middle domain/FliG N-terminal domain/FliG C-terminal domain